MSSATVSLSFLRALELVNHAIQNSDNFFGAAAIFDGAGELMSKFGASLPSKNVTPPATLADIQNDFAQVLQEVRTNPLYSRVPDIKIDSSLFSTFTQTGGLAMLWDSLLSANDADKFTKCWVSAQGKSSQVQCLVEAAPKVAAAPKVVAFEPPRQMQYLAGVAVAPKSHVSTKDIILYSAIAVLGVALLSTATALIVGKCKKD
jgi:hypothetical protein